MGNYLRGLGPKCPDRRRLGSSSSLPGSQRSMLSRGGWIIPPRFRSAGLWRDCWLATDECHGHPVGIEAVTDQSTPS